MLEIKNLYSGYDNIDIIKKVNISIDRGKNLCIVGPTGCGTSTLLKSIANIIDYKGSIRIDNKEISKLNRKDLAKKIGLMSQISEVYFPYTVYEAVSLGRYCYTKGPFSSLSKEDYKVIDECIDIVGLSKFKDQMINELSGGQLQRVFLARAFAQDSEVILLDEPTNHLDLKHQIEILDHLNKWAKKNNKIVVGVLHDLNLVQHFADNVIILDHGEIVSYGKAKDVLIDKTLKDVYGIDIKSFMIDTLRKWE
ncbi:MAG: ABC transporter ATP-binding protein [Romboutsia sp.]|uniref:ABC transporter ATP-binding protein n=1 Tax=Romboutsia sp. TaxID=1965302 RepID=UPI003F3EFA32